MAPSPSSAGCIGGIKGAADAQLVHAHTEYMFWGKFAPIFRVGYLDTPASSSIPQNYRGPIFRGLQVLISVESAEK